MNAYKPIDCRYYDLLELLVSRKAQTRITYSKEDGSVVDAEEVGLKDLQTTSEGEFLLLDHDSEAIRLDRLVKVGDETFLGSCKV